MYLLVRVVLGSAGEVSVELMFCHLESQGLV